MGERPDERAIRSVVRWFPRPSHSHRSTLDDPDSSSIAGRRASGFLQVSLSKVSRPEHRGARPASNAETRPMNANDDSMPNALSASPHRRKFSRGAAHRPRDVDDHVIEDTGCDRPGVHELSKLHVTGARWSADKIGLTIIAAPHRGHAHVARDTGSAVIVGVASLGGAADDGVASKVRASATCQR